MHVALTGATGFLGRYVTPALAGASVSVTAVVRAHAEPKPWLAGANTVEMDISAPPADAFERLGKPDALVHLAWQGLPNYQSLHHFETELPIQYRFLRTLIDAGLKRLVVTGTCFEYGMQSGRLAESLPATPTNPYGFAKDALRRQLQYLQVSKSFSLAWARLFYMYGEGQAPNSLLPQLERAIASDAPVFNMSGGEQLRDYLPVSEVAQTLARLALSNADPGVVNVCAGNPVSVRALVEQRIAERGASIALNRGFYPYSDYEPMAFWGDRTKLALLLEAE